MILREQQNTSVSAPQTADFTATLAAFRTWKQMAWLTADDLYTFLTGPSVERDEFLASLTGTTEVISGKYITQNYTA